MSNRPIPASAPRLPPPALPSLATLLLLLPMLLAPAQAAQAPQPPAPAAMTLKQAIERGKIKRLSVRIADAEVETFRARISQARAQRWPSLDLAANVTDTNNYDSFSGVNATVTLPGLDTPSTVSVTQTVPRYQTSGGVKLRYPVYAGGRIEAQVDRQEQALLAAEVKRSIVVRNVALEIAQAYFKLRSACIKRDIAQRRTQRALQDNKLAQQRLRDGHIAAIDASQIQLALTENQVALRASNEDLNIAQTDFIASQSEVSGQNDALTPNCGFTSPIADDLAWMEKTLADASLETQYNQLQVRAAQKTVQMERAARLPQLNLTAQYAGVGRSTSSSSGAFDDFRRQLATVGVDFSIKLFDGGLTRSRIAEAQSEVKRLSLLAQRDAGELKQARKRDQQRMRTAQDNVELARARFELAQKQSAVARQQQTSGSGSVTAANQQSERMYDAQDEYRLAELDLALARIAALQSGGRTQPGATGPESQ